jgi:hypothetical protein
MSILDSIKRFFAPKGDAVQDERGDETAETNEPHGEVSTDVTGKAVDTVVGRYVGETKPEDAERLADPDAP